VSVKTNNVANTNATLNNMADLTC